MCSQCSHEQGKGASFNSEYIEGVNSSQIYSVIFLWTWCVQRIQILRTSQWKRRTWQYQAPDGHTYSGHRCFWTWTPCLVCDKPSRFHLSLTCWLLQSISPGRFFAVNELKAIFTYCILNYDIQLEGGSMDRPTDQMFGSNLFPDVKAKLMFKRRSSHK